MTEIRNKIHAAFPEVDSERDVPQLVCESTGHDVSSVVRALGEMTTDGTLAMWFQVRSPTNGRRLYNFATLDEVPETALDWHHQSSPRFAVTPDLVRVVYRRGPKFPVPSIVKCTRYRTGRRAGCPCRECLAVMRAIEGRCEAVAEMDGEELKVRLQKFIRDHEGPSLYEWEEVVESLLEDT